MIKPKKIAPSLLSSNFANLEKDIAMVEEAKADLLHIDVMDGHFVPNITMGPVVVKAINRVAQIPLDVHLMIENPGRYIDAFAEAGADYLTIHVEACPHLHKDIQAIKESGMKAGVALNPHTPLSSIEEVLADLDLVLLMSVNPGFGGQSFIHNTLEKLRRMNIILAERELSHIELEVDGGVKLDNIAEVAAAGADILVSGSGIFKNPDPIQTIHQMRTKMLFLPDSVG